MGVLKKRFGSYYAEWKGMRGAVRKRVRLEGGAFGQTAILWDMYWNQKTGEPNYVQRCLFETK